MQPVHQDYSPWRGDYFAAALRVRSRVWNAMLNNGVGGWEPGPYKDLTGWTGLFQVRPNPDSDVISATGTVTVLDQTTTLGGVRYSLTGTQTQALKGPYSFDVQLTDTDDNPRTFIEGVLTFGRDTSHA